MSIYLIFEFIQISFTICLIICEIIEYRERQILVNNLSKTKNPIVRKCMNEGYKKLKNCLWKKERERGNKLWILWILYFCTWEL